MLQKTLRHPPLALWERVKAGQNIGINTSLDKICALCYDKGEYTPLKTGVCPVHGCAPLLPEYMIEHTPKHRGKYEASLIERTRKMSVPSVSDLNRMKQIVRAGLVGVSEDLGEWTDHVVALVAYDALRFGLAPGTEIFPYIKKDKDGKITGVTAGINYKGLERSARRQSHFIIPDEGMRRLSADEVRERGLHVVPFWVKNKPNPEDVIAIEAPLYRLDVYEKQVDLATKAKAAGIAPLPVGPTSVGFGIWLPGETIPTGRSAEWRAKMRARKDAILKAFTLSYELTSQYYEPDAPGPVIAADTDDEPLLLNDVNTLEFITSDAQETGNVLPGKLLNKTQRDWVLAKIKDANHVPSVLLQHMFGDTFRPEHMTDIAGKNMAEFLKREKLLRDGGDPATIGIESADLNVMIEHLVNDCATATLSGTLLHE